MLGWYVCMGFVAKAVLSTILIRKKGIWFVTEWKNSIIFVVPLRASSLLPFSSSSSPFHSYNKANLSCSVISYDSLQLLFIFLFKLADWCLPNQNWLDFIQFHFISSASVQRRQVFQFLSTFNHHFPFFLFSPCHLRISPQSINWYFASKSFCTFRLIVVGWVVQEDPSS